MRKLFCVFLLLTLQFEYVGKAKIVTENRAYSYEVMKEDLSKIQQKYEDVVKIKTIGTSHFGRNIFAIKLGKGEKNIVIIGAHHGREWLTSMLIMKKLEGYARAYQKDTRFGKYSTDVLNDVSIWFIPMVNPDGVTIQQNHIDYFPNHHQKNLVVMNKGLNNFERWKANGIGIDLNRQYPAGWEELKEGPEGPFYQFYKGTRPLEANEVKVLTKFIDQINPVIAVSYHSAGREVFWNYHNGKNLKRDKHIAKKISKLTGYKMAVPPKQAVGGGFTDWFITKYHRPAMTIEISYLVGETSPPLSVFKSEWKRNKYVGLTLAKEAKRISRK